MQLIDVTRPAEPAVLGRLGHDVGLGGVDGVAFTPAGYLATVANGPGSSVDALALWDVADRVHPRALGPPVVLGPPPFGRRLIGGCGRRGSGLVLR